MPNQFGLNHESVPVEKCEVSDREALRAYRQKRAQWLRWYTFTEKHPNSIQGQIIGMTFLDMSYRTLAKPRSETPSFVRIAARNGLLAHMLDQGYVATQILAIRRLLDNGKGTVSVQRLLTEISKGRKLITRQNYVAYDGTPYDPEGWKLLPPTIETAIWGAESPGLFNFLTSKHRHEMFDRLSGKSPVDRAPNDLIEPSIFSRLQSWLDSIEATNLVKLSHEFFAHAAEKSHQGELEYKGVLLSDIESAQKVIIRVERAIADDILFIATARDVVAIEPLGLLKALDSPYAESEMIEQMQHYWDQLRADRNSWKDRYREDLYPPSTGTS